MKKIFYIVCIGLVAACKNMPKKNEKVTADRLITPGKSIGYIHLEEHSDTLVDSLGKPDAGDAAMGKSVNIWDTKNGNLTTFNSRKMGIENFSRIKLIRSTDAQLKTANHLGIGSELADLKKEFTLVKIGTFTENGIEKTLYDTSSGIAFELNKDNICTGILIHDKDTTATASYIPIYNNLKTE
ncbi:hypothetical protein ACG2LH_03040 [Zhouia sp. PK063]|uniref:hypothetical protein n=1 Tax=Zhouia sp. PK063 TaxID=3373602 RepID=UPI0037B888C8